MTSGPVLEDCGSGAAGTSLTYRDDSLSLRLLGPFDARVGGAPMPALRTRKGQWLLALCVLNADSALDRDWLAATLWPESLPEQALGGLRRALTDLRTALGAAADRLSHPTPRTLRLSLSPCDTVDVVAFDAALAAGDAASLRRAVDLYHGALLAACVEPWIADDRQRYAARYVQGLDTLTQMMRVAGDTDSVVDLLRRRITAEPLAEEGHRALMRALAEAGDRAAAVQIYRDLRVRLYAETGFEPADETTALFRQIRLSDGGAPHGGARTARSPAASSPAAIASGAAQLPSLPQPLTELIGREESVRDILRLLTGTRLLTLAGPGGVGKTRLAIAVAQAVVRFGSTAGADAHLFEKIELPSDHAQASGRGLTVAGFVDLAAVTDPTLVAQAIAGALGVRPAPGQEALPAVIRALTEASADADLLLVVDNCEHLLPTPSTVCGQLLQSCPGLRILATSQTILGLTGETIWTVPSLTDDDAVRLFLARARDVQPRTSLTDAAREAVVQVCRRLDGIPLAIELAAVRLRVLSPEQIAARLDDRFHLLTDGNRGALPRQRTLRAALDWSHDLLSEPERMLLRRLSVFAGGAALAAVRVVCFDADTPEWEALDRISALVDRSLVNTEPGVDYGSSGATALRYGQLETVRQYAAERLAQAGEEACLRLRHLRAFRALAEEAAGFLRGPQQASWLNRLEDDLDNIRAALQWASRCVGAPEGVQRQAVTEALHLVGAMGALWVMRGYLAEGSAAAARLLTRSDTLFRQEEMPEDGQRARSLALHTAAVVAYRQGDYAAAIRLHRENLALRERLCDAAGVATTLVSLGNVYSDQGDVDAAQPLMERGLAHWRELDNIPNVASTLFNLGTLLYHRTEQLPAGVDAAMVRPYYEESLELFQQIGHTLGIANCRHSLGLLECRECGYRKVSPHLLGCAPLYRELGDRRMLAGLLEEFSNVALARQDWTLSIRLVAAATAARDICGVPLRPAGAAEQAASIAEVRASMGEESFACAWADGYALSLDAAVDAALDAFGSAAVGTESVRP